MTTNRKCSLCSREMVPLPVTTPSGKAMQVSFCRICDRRRCSACGHHEQNTIARACSVCEVSF